MDLPASYAAWAQDAKQRLLGLSAPALALLSKFLDLRLGRRREDASEAAGRLRLLAREVGAALERAEGLRGARARVRVCVRTCVCACVQARVCMCAYACVCVQGCVCTHDFVLSTGLPGVWDVQDPMRFVPVSARSWVCQSTN